jgi:phage tail sheath protein FI
MAFQVSPGVQVKEIDATGVVPAVSSSIGGTAGSFNWGPVGEIVTVTSEKELAATFGTPDTHTYKYFLTAASFLKYGGALKVVRAKSGHDNATVAGGGLFVGNETDYEALNLGSTSEGAWVAKYPGDLGNSLQVSVCPANATAFTGWAYAGEFSAAPDTSDYADELGKSSAADELHIVVIDQDGAWSGKEGTILETFEFLSQGSDAKNSDGSSNYYADVINARSDYIRFLAAPTGLTDAGNAISGTTTYTTVTAAITNSLSGGTDDNQNVTPGEIQTGLELFADAETVDVNLLFAYPDAQNSKVIAEKLITIAKNRKDCMAFVSPPVEDSRDAADPATSVNTWVNASGTALTSSSYAAVDSTAVYVYDKYNDVYRWIGAAGHQAGLCANTDNVADAWFSPAGVNRGQLLGITKLAFNPTKANRDTLYKGRINPIVSLPGQGTVLFGDKTLLKRPSAFDRINVRRLFIVLEKAISTAAEAQLFEFNDEFTRAQFRNLVEPFLRDVKGRRGVTEFAVVCDETNNTGQVIDANSFVADIFIKPARSINFITLNFVATRTGVDFSEISGV